MKLPSSGKRQPFTIQSMELNVFSLLFAHGKGWNSKERATIMICFTGRVCPGLNELFTARYRFGRNKKKKQTPGAIVGVEMMVF